MSAKKLFQVRGASPADARQILDCLHAAFAPYREQYSAEGFTDTVLTPETISRRLATMAIFLAESDEGAIVGTIACHALTASEGHIRGMAVLPAWQGRGVAEELLSSAELELQRQGCDFVTLDTTQPLQRAIRFYERHGYRKTGRIADFFGMPLYEYSKTLRQQVRQINEQG